MGAERVLVTGAGGFIGRHVREVLEDRGHDVVPIDHRWGSSDELRDRVSAAAPTSCIHLGWYAQPADYLTSIPGNRASLDDSLDLVAALGDAGCRHLVVAGSCAEYGPGRSDPIGEDDPVAPWSAYGAAKAALHLLLASSLRPAGLRVAWARLFNVTGPGEDSVRLFPMVVREVAAGRTVALTSGEQRRDYLDVADVAMALVRLGEERADGVYNVCSGHGLPLRELLTGLATRAGDVHLLEFGARERGEHDEAFVVGDNRRLIDATGWHRTIDVDAMLDRVVASCTLHERSATEP